MKIKRRKISLARLLINDNNSKVSKQYFLFTFKHIWFSAKTVSRIVKLLVEIHIQKQCALMSKKLKMTRNS